MTGWIVFMLATLSPMAAADLTACITVNGAASTYASKRIASSVFAKAGLAIDWRPKPTAPEPSGVCLRIELAEGTPDELLPGALAVSHPYGGCSTSIIVFFDRVRSLTRGFEQESRLLAYVLVHEITHVVQGVDRHSGAGLMKAHWSAEDRQAILEGRLDFLEEDLLLIRRGLATGWCSRRAALIARSESGIAVRPE